MDQSPFEERLEKDFPWPEIGDTPFSQGQPASAAWLAQHTDYRFYDMIEGYKLAADLLVEHADVGRWSKLVYPVVFCYRHYLEITLKVMLEKYGPMANIEPNRSNHTLEGLWRDFRRLLHGVDVEGGSGDKQATEIVGECIAEFAKIDPGSQTFRYPISKKGRPFALGLSSIDLSRLRDTMQKMDTYFMCVDACLARIKEAREEQADILATLHPTDY